MWWSGPTCSVSPSYISCAAVSVGPASGPTPTCSTRLINRSPKRPTGGSRRSARRPTWGPVSSWLCDLEIRGAGSVLGEIQSGQIAAVGFDLYAEMVADAIRQMEGTEPPPEPSEVRIELPVVAHLPPEYVGDDEARLEAYRRLAEADTVAAVDDVAVEWVDRYGPPPEAALQLLDVAKLRVEALRIGLAEVVQLRHEVRLAPVDLTTSQEVRLQRLSPKAVLRPTDSAMFIPAPKPLVTGLVAFLTAMWPPLDQARIAEEA